MTQFNKKILFVGYGAVAECTLPILLKLVKVPARNITVMDFVNKSAKLKAWTSKGVKFVKDRVTEENMGKVLSKYVSEGDLIIDLAWNIDACEILQWFYVFLRKYLKKDTPKYLFPGGLCLLVFLLL